MLSYFEGSGPGACRQVSKPSDTSAETSMGLDHRKCTRPAEAFGQLQCLALRISVKISRRTQWLKILRTPSIVNDGRSLFCASNTQGFNHNWSPNEPAWPRRKYLGLAGKRLQCTCLSRERGHQARHRFDLSRPSHICGFLPRKSWD